MKLIIITTDRIFEDEPSACNQLFARGMTVLHLRKPSASEKDVRDFLSGIHPAYHHRIVLHDCFSLARLFGLQGVHLNRRNPFPPQQAAGALSRSCHSMEELEEMDGFSHVFLSPVFDSISKKEYARAFTEEDLLSAKAKGLINGKVIALGGISAATIPLAAQYGFGGVAVLGALWGDYPGDKDIKGLLQRFDELLDITRKQ
jgi:thiamine-phosphate pyrophosphorylase